MAVAPYNVTFSAASPVFTYTPFRDGDLLNGWNATAIGSLWPTGTAYRCTQAASATLAFNFYGTSLRMCVLPSIGYGVNIDNTPYPWISSQSGACSSYPGEIMITFDGLHATEHTVALTSGASPDSEFCFLGATTTMAVNGGGTVVEKPIDDQDPSWIFQPGRGSNAWDSHTEQVGAGHSNDSETFDCIYTPDHVASLNFSGASGLVLWGAHRVTYEFYTITLNEETFRLDASDPLPQDRYALFARGGLDPKQNYTLSIQNWNDDKPCEDHMFPCCMTIDDVVLLSVTGDKTSASGTSTATETQPTTTDDPRATDPPPRSHKNKNLPAILGGTLGGAAVLIFLGLLAHILWTRRKRGPRDTLSIASLDDGHVSPWQQTWGHVIPSPVAHQRARSDASLSMREREDVVPAQLHNAGRPAEAASVLSQGWSVVPPSYRT
ncbi:hypothetical protein EXIGLDRAFT_831668 [Exidia glandulosa HHB12029]|uniref:Uncharacterized protein n=1 Tax=Exidia glandulosa HHB12029 TaxID=1314781 RepID=A0A165MD75_EXIGL|nr:hypothetical protein EXIGLDRAFT_831668 [Exidia glandulosa HHB12029]